MKLLNFRNHGDKRGSLVAIESNKQIPFNIKRIYYIFGNKKKLPRGYHAHKKLKQIYIVLSGSCRIILDNGKKKKTVFLTSPLTGLFIDRMTWREIHNFSQNCILLVLASDFYKEKDYIKKYHDFKKLVKLR